MIKVRYNSSLIKQANSNELSKQLVENNKWHLDSSMIYKHN
jgi:hypothetical protein